MKPEIKKKWVQTLRSGKFQQGQGCLRQGDKFCCLGVLCELHREETHGEWKLGNYLGAVQLPPDEVSNWSGLTSLDRIKTIAGMNDGGVSFETIADQIEKFI